MANTIRIKYLYVLTSTSEDYYSEQVYLSASTLRDSNPKAFLSLLTDKDTYQYLTKDFVKLLALFDECKVVDAPFDNNFAKSRYLKTTMREHIKGNFLYIDGDTIICRDLSDIKKCKYDIAGVLSDNKEMPKENAWVKRYEKLGYGETPSIFINGGLLFVKDTKLAHKFFKEWNEKWTESINNGVKHDQPSLNKVNSDFGNIIGLLPDEWNMQTFFNGRRMSNARIVHYFASLKVSNYLNIIFDKIKAEKDIDSKTKEIILEAIKSGRVDMREYKYYLAECLIIKNENQYLLEHLEKGIQAGIEHFFIYDNLSKESVSEFLKDTKYEEYCTVELWQNTKNNQLDCYAHFLKEHREDVKWCAFIDTDEMLEGNLYDLCKKNEDFLSLKVEQVVHGCNGQAYADYSKSLTDRFQSHILRVKIFKMVVQLKYLDYQYPHHSYIDSEKAKDIPVFHWLKTVYINEECQLHHYFFKSFEEWVVKCLRGNVFAKDKGWKLKLFFDENKIPEKDKQDIMSKYKVNIENSMEYGGKD